MAWSNCYIVTEFPLPRFICELFNPKLKCERKGHVPKVRTLQVMKRYDYPYVAASFGRTEHYCKRCKAETAPPMDVFIKGYHSLEMTTDRWNEMDRRGYVIECVTTVEFVSP